MPNVMAAQANIGRAVCESSLIPFLVPRHKVWLISAAGVPCSDTANVGARLGRKVSFAPDKIPSGREPPKMYIWCTSPGDGQTLCKVWLACSERRHCSNEAKIRNPMKFAGVPETHQPISAVNGLKFAILWGHLKEMLFNNFFRIVDTCLICKDIAGQSCAMVRRWRFFASFLRPLFSASLVQYISDLHSKFALRLDYVTKYGRHPACNRWD